MNNAHVAADGLLLTGVVETVSKRSSLLIVQSVQTGELLALKIMRPAVDDEEYPAYAEPLELRISTWQDTLPSSDFPNYATLGALPQNAPFFNKLKFWQHYISNNRGIPAYALFFEYCNGGDLRSFIEKYQGWNLAIPEHFIWLVAEQLCLAIAWLHFGERPNVRGHQAPANWTRLYHRDLFPQNVFINYSPRRGGRIPAPGVETNAFPQIVLGDFGNSALDTDDTKMIPLNVLGGESAEDTELRIWEDTYGLGNTLRRLCQAHLPHTDANSGDVDWNERRPDNIRMADLNAQDGSAPDFSDQLIDLLGNFEYDGMETGTDITDLEDPGAATTADSRWIVDTLYPAARDRVAAYRNPPGGRPAGYLDELDVSWTKPKSLMPFVYNTSYKAAAGDFDDDDDGVNEDDLNDNDSEVIRMRRLGLLHQWDDVRPSYELCSLEFNRSTMRPLEDQPPGADDGADDGGDDGSDDGGG